MPTARFVLLLFATCRASVALVIEHDKPYGEPFQLAGNRLVFTSWDFIRPGQIDWTDKAGQSVYAQQSADLGLGEADFSRIDCPRGVRLVAEPAQRLGPIIQREFRAGSLEK